MLHEENVTSHAIFSLGVVQSHGPTHPFSWASDVRRCFHPVFVQGPLMCTTDWKEKTQPSQLRHQAFFANISHSSEIKRGVFFRKLLLRDYLLSGNINFVSEFKKKKLSFLWAPFKGQFLYFRRCPINGGPSVVISFIEGNPSFQVQKGPFKLRFLWNLRKKKTKQKWENLFRILTENLEALDFYQDFCWTWTLVRLNVIVTWSVNVSVILNVIEILSVTCNKKVKCNLHKGWAEDNWNVVKRLLGTHTNGVTFRLF